MLLTIQNFIAHLHPALVHLPVGILFIVCLYQLWPRKPVDQSSPFVFIALLTGAISAGLSCISGFLLSGSGDYDKDLVSTHQWMGISLFIATLALSFIQYYAVATRQLKWLYGVVFIMMVMTGHLGGSLTHGTGYVTEALFTDPDGTEENVPRKIITNPDSAIVYEDLIQPLLQQKCYSCHGRNKQKGGLRMDKITGLLKGGKDGVVLIPGNASNSELVKRIQLPKNHDDHMPPEEKPQLTEQEIKMIHWWVANGAGFDKTLPAFSPPDEMRKFIVSYLNEKQELPAPPILPAGEVNKANQSAIDKLKNAGAVVLPIAQNSHFLMVNLVNANVRLVTEQRLLVPINNQLISLRAGNTAVSDSLLEQIGLCKNLIRLHLDHSRVTDGGLKQLKQLKLLQYLNVVGTVVSIRGLEQLQGLNELGAVYCYQSAVQQQDLLRLKKIFPTTRIDLGGYQVPILVGDTSEVKSKKPAY